jgi:hypothetical protein
MRSAIGRKPPRSWSRWDRRPSGLDASLATNRLIGNGRLTMGRRTGRLLCLYAPRSDAMEQGNHTMNSSCSAFLQPGKSRRNRKNGPLPTARPRRSWEPMGDVRGLGDRALVCLRGVIDRIRTRPASRSKELVPDQSVAPCTNIEPGDSTKTAPEVLSKVVDGGNERGGVPLVKSHPHQNCRRGRGVRHREPVYLRDPHRAIAREP